MSDTKVTNNNGYGPGWIASLRAAASEADALRAELDKWRTWKPDYEDLKSLAQQAMKRDGSHSESLAACWAYIRGLEAWLREHDALRATVAEQARQIETARDIALAYSREHPVWQDVDGNRQDPHGVHAWLAANAPTPAQESAAQQSEHEDVARAHCVHCGNEMPKNEIRCFVCHP